VHIAVHIVSMRYEHDAQAPETEAAVLMTGDTIYAPHPEQASDIAGE
jgi:hypothetical protein